jgi:hypothetical protein
MFLTQAALAVEAASPLMTAVILGLAIAFDAL